MSSHTHIPENLLKPHICETCREPTYSSSMSLDGTQAEEGAHFVYDLVPHGNCWAPEVDLPSAEPPAATERLEAAAERALTLPLVGGADFRTGPGGDPRAVARAIVREVLEEHGEHDLLASLGRGYRWRLDRFLGRYWGSMTYPGRGKDKVGRDYTPDREGIARQVDETVSESPIPPPPPPAKSDELAFEAEA